MGYYGLWEARWKSSPLEGQLTTIGGRGFKRIDNAIEALGLPVEDEFVTQSWDEIMEQLRKDASPRPKPGA